MPPKKAAAAAADDTFAILLRYADFSGEELSAIHAATAAGIGRSTAFARVAKAKAQAGSGGPFEKIKCTDPQAFTVLLKYAQACGKELRGPHAAKAAGIGRSTAFAKIKQAKEALEAEGGEGSADASVEVKFPTNEISVKKEGSPTKKTQVKKDSPTKKITKVKKEQTPDNELAPVEEPSTNELNEDQSPIKSNASMPSVDTFAILLRYADLSGEKLKAAEAATAAGISNSTAQKRINKAKEVAVQKTPKKGKETVAEKMDEDETGIKEEATEEQVATKEEAEPEKVKAPPKSPKKPRETKAAKVKNEETEEVGESANTPFLDPLRDIPAKSSKKSPAKGGAVAGQDAFAVLIRYADFSGEKLIAQHAATATGTALRTAYTRISKAKADLDAGIALPKGGGTDVFPVLLKYAKASSTELVAAHAAKAAEIALRTAYNNMAQAKKAMDEGKGGEDGESGEGMGATSASMSPTKRDTRKRKAVDHAEDGVEEHVVSKKVKLGAEGEGATADVGETAEAAEEGVVDGVAEETASEALVADEVEDGGEDVKDDSSVADVYNEIEKRIKDEEY